MFERIESEVSNASKLAGLRAAVAKRFVVTTASGEEYHVWAMTAKSQAEYAANVSDKSPAIWALDPALAHPADHFAISYSLSRAIKESAPLTLYRLSADGEVAEQSEQKITGFHTV